MRGKPWILALFLASSACADGGEPLDAAFDDACFGKCDSGVGLTLRAGPRLLEWDELVALSEMPGRREGDRYVVDGASPQLATAVDDLLSDAFISNEAFERGARPHRPEDETLGPSLRAVFWNIERGQQLPAILDAFAAASDDHARETFFAERVVDDAPVDELNIQLDALADLDVVILDEVDRNMKRSGYADVVVELAEQLDMNWAYGVEFIEIDPIALGTETFVREDFLPGEADSDELHDDGEIPEMELAARAAEANALIEVDPTRSRNVHGNAVLSRYPILSARTIPLRTVCWDWNEGERQPKSWLQKGPELVAEKLFLTKTMREIRHGGRTMLLVDLWVPGVNADGTSLEFVEGGRRDVVTVVSTHLENRTTPKCRAQQMKEVLEHLKGVTNPVILAGDLNTFGGDGRPVTIERLLMSRFGNPEWVAKQVITRLVPYAGWVFNISSAVNFVRLKDDPTVANIPLLLPNPEKGLFDAVERHVFADFARFDFRGDESRTVNGTGKTLANSNQRDSKGFKTTSALERTIGIGELTLFGKWKIDWMFVRGYQRSPRDTKATYRMAPHWPRTLEELRDATRPRLSDHAPMTVDLPLGDTCKDGTCTGNAVPPLTFGDTTWTEVNAE